MKTRKSRKIYLMAFLVGAFLWETACVTVKIVQYPVDKRFIAGYPEPVKGRKKRHYSKNLNRNSYKTTVRQRRIKLYDGYGIVGIAKRYIGTPYRFKGNSPSGFDCSGFTQYVYRRAGFKLPHSARMQYKKLIPVKRPRVGDLVFFRTSGRHITHVGIYAGNYKFLHSPRTGKTVGFSDLRNPYWRKKYAGARTIFLYK